MAVVSSPMLSGIHIPLTPILGRERELKAAHDLLARPQVRLVTMTGPGGVGKTRLAGEIANTSRFASAVLFVALADVRDPALILAAIAQELEIPAIGDQPLLQRVVLELEGQELLLILDNFEHLMNATSVVSDLLTACPQLRILVTSRERLRLRAEWELPIAPLPVPEVRRADPEGAPETGRRVEENELLDSSTARLLAFPSVALFVERAQAARHDFVLSPENAADVAEICRRLDGMPLAIELAAARTKVLAPARLAERLGRQLPLLTGGPRDLPDRLRTMHGAIAWSHDLLTPDEQALFRRLAVFIGGVDLAAAEAIGTAGRRDGGTAGNENTLLSVSPSLRLSVFDLIGSLVDKSLVQAVDRRQDEGDEPRFRLLEPVREFGLEQLATRGEEAETRHRHAEWFLTLAEDAAAGLSGPKRVTWLRRIDMEFANLEAVFAWAEAQGESEAGQRLIGALREYFGAYARFGIGRTWAERMLALDSAPTIARIRALHTAATLAYRQRDIAATLRLGTESLEIAQQLGDTIGTSRALLTLGHVGLASRDYTQAIARYAEGLEVSRRLGNPHSISMSLSNLARAEIEDGILDRAPALLEEALALARGAGDAMRTAFTFVVLGQLAQRQGDLDLARSRFEEALAIQREADPRTVPGTLAYLAEVAREQGELARAASLLRECLTIQWERGELHATLTTLSSLAELAAASDRADAAARLFGAVDSLRSSLPTPTPPADTPRSQGGLDTVRAELGEQTFLAAYEIGERLDLAGAVALADQVAGALAEPESPLGLTARELEVLRLVAAGRSDREIGEVLYISPRTASRHIANILGKLPVDSRAAAATFARQQGLV